MIYVNSYNEEPEFSISINLLTHDGDTHSLLYKLEMHTKLNDITYEVSNLFTWK